MVISIHDHSLYGIACIQCGQTLIAPDCSRYVRSRIVRHAWSCESCGVRFETSDHLRLSEHRRTVRAVRTLERLVSSGSGKCSICGRVKGRSAMSCVGRRRPAQAPTSCSAEARG